MIAHEGGYVNDPDDPGGETYKGISRKNWPDWEGWKFIDILKAKTRHAFIDADAIALEEFVKRFYLVNFWNKIGGDNIQNQEVANSIFDFAVNAGATPSAELAQKIVGTKPDGIIGEKTAEAINAFNPDHFVAAFAVAKIRRYIQIIAKRPASKKYFTGWVIRSVSYLVILFFALSCRPEPIQTKPTTIVKVDSVFLKEYVVKRMNEHELLLVSITDTVIIYMENTYGFDERIVFIKK